MQNFPQRGNDRFPTNFLRELPTLEFYIKNRTKERGEDALWNLRTKRLYEILKRSHKMQIASPPHRKKVSNKQTIPCSSSDFIRFFARLLKTLLLILSFWQPPGFKCMKNLHFESCRSRKVISVFPRREHSLYFWFQLGGRKENEKKYICLPTVEYNDLEIFPLLRGLGCHVL